ncbi:MAG TPA: J domain-containing protein [Kofleriaceae bacterium]|nr:J domain-containing protein [Kofleriaceae bacterium]
MRGPIEPNLRRSLGAGQLVCVLYQLGQAAASGVLTLAGRTPRPEVFVVRRGAAVCAEGELARRDLIARLARCAAEPAISLTFEGGVTAYPPGALHQVALAGWARSHVEAQLDAQRADALVREVAGMRLAARAELAPEPRDDADRRMLAALARPRRLDEIWRLARTPKFRLLALVYFLRAIDALEVESAAAERPASPSSSARSSGHAPARAVDPRRAAAQRLLGIDDPDDVDAIKRAYRRLARALHPDLQPDADDRRRRTLERRFAELTAAYEALV